MLAQQLRRQPCRLLLSVVVTVTVVVVVIVVGPGPAPHTGGHVKNWIDMQPTGIKC